MTVPIKTISTAIAGVGLSGGLGYLYLYNKRTQEQSKSLNTSATLQQNQKPQFYDPRPFKQLTSEEIDSRLRAGQFVNKSPIQRVKAIYTTRMASNNPVEDNYSINTIDGDKLMAGVYDGRGNSFILSCFYTATIVSVIYLHNLYIKMSNERQNIHVKQ